MVSDDKFRSARPKQCVPETPRDRWHVTRRIGASARTHSAETIWQKPFGAAECLGALRHGPPSDGFTSFPRSAWERTFPKLCFTCVPKRILFVGRVFRTPNVANGDGPIAVRPRVSAKRNAARRSADCADSADLNSKKSASSAKSADNGFLRISWCLRVLVVTICLTLGYPEL
jgi:hypothetical protein